MFAKLSALVGTSSGLPFVLETDYGPSWGQWTHASGTLTSDGSRVSIFRVSAQRDTDPVLIAARNGVKRLKMLRHPNILRYVDTVEVEERGDHVVYLVTEDVKSLKETMQQLHLEDGDKEKFLMMGLEQVVSAVSFLNNDCGLIHGNVCSMSVCVTDTLDFKVYAFDLTTEHNLVGQMSASPPLMASSWLVAPQYKSGELGRSEWDVIADAPAWAVDAWGLGCLIQESFSGVLLSQMEDLKNLGCIPVSLKPYYQKLLASQPAKRMNPAEILDAQVLKNNLLMMVTFLQNLAVKDGMEKDSFFQRLNTMMADVPEVIAQKKILPLLASALEYGGAPPSALTTLMNVSKTMSNEDKEKMVVPVIIKLFSSQDRGIRRCLLEHIQSFGPEMSNQLVEDQIYPKIQPGFTDANPYIRELTLKSMVILGPKLNSRTLNQTVLKFLAKLQVDEEPGIRANTTILLGTLSSHFSESTRKKVLLNAMARALKDPFPPAKMAALKSLQNTVTVHSIDDIATKVIPMISPLCVDSVQEVRGMATTCLEEFFNAIKEQQETPPPATDEGTLDDRSMIRHARDTSGTIPEHVVEHANEALPPHHHAQTSSFGWENDDDILEDMMDAAAAEREARARLNKISVASSSTTTSSSSAAAAAGRRRAKEAPPKTGSTIRKTGGGGMKLGAKKLATNDDDDFDDW